jgi:Resolvase, N terminal domain
VRLAWEAAIVTTAPEASRGHARAARAGGLAAWAEASGRPQGKRNAGGRLRFAFYGRVSTEDWQDPVTSRARQREQAEALVRGHGRVVADFFDEGESRSVAWGRRPRAAALAAQLADPDRGWDAIVVGEYERAFYGSQYAMMAPLLERYPGSRCGRCRKGWDAPLDIRRSAQFRYPRRPPVEQGRTG